MSLSSSSFDPSLENKHQILPIQPAKGEFITSNPVTDILREGIPSVKSSCCLSRSHPLQGQFGSQGLQAKWKAQLERNSFAFGHGFSELLDREMKILSSSSPLPCMLSTSSSSRLGQAVLMGRDTEIEMDDWVGWERPLSFVSPAVLDIHSVIERSLGWNEDGGDK